MEDIKEGSAAIVFLITIVEKFYDLFHLQPGNDNPLTSNYNPKARASRKVTWADAKNGWADGQIAWADAQDVWAGAQIG